MDFDNIENKPCIFYENVLAIELNEKGLYVCISEKASLKT